MPNNIIDKIDKIIDKGDIYSKVIIVLTTNKTFNVLNIMDPVNPITIANVKDADMALLVRKAYCDGYYDASHEQ